jgi:hypothetical protein
MVYDRSIMVMHKKKPAAEKSHYWVMLKLCEPEYETERKFIQTEVAFAKHKAAKHKNSLLREWSLPALGFYGHKTWHKYVQDLHNYEHKLAKYQDAVEDGVLPIKFAVYNDGGVGDAQVKIQVHVENGRLDEDKKQPERPERLDGRGKASKFSWPRLSGFSRSQVRITPHKLAAKFSSLGPDDGAVLVNQIVHLHTEAGTKLTYEISSQNVAHETGEVEL